MFRLTIFCFATVLIIGWSKDKAGDKLHGEWTLKSQYDIMGGVRGYILFDQTIPKKLRFSPEGKVYSTGIVTPTWIFQPYPGSASYYINGEMIHIGDSTVVNGALVYLTPKKQFQIKSASQNLLILQHIYPFTDPAPPVTIDSLIR